MDYRENERASGRRIGLTIGAIVVGIIVLLFGGSMALRAALSSPATTPPAPIETVNPPESTSTSVEPTPAAETTPVAQAEEKPVEQPKAEEKPAPAPPPTPAPAKSVGVVVIDPGHQAKGDSSHEPIGPGASTTKPKVTSGTSGVASGVAESQTNLEVAKRLRSELEKRGVKVILVRESQNVNMSNSERAAVANEAKADLFIRLHCDGAGSASAKGLSTLVPAKNEWTGPIVGASGSAGKLVHAATVKATGASDRGVVPRSDLSGFNWSKVPTILVEMGFMSNPDEDRRLNSDAYQQKLAAGMANGIVAYLK